MTSETQRKATEATVTALFFVETRNRAEIEEISRLVDRMRPYGQVRPIAEGIITAYALRLPTSALPLLASVETTIKRDYLFGHVQVPFQDTALRVVEDLAMETGSALYEIEACAMCHAPEPFPVTAPVRSEDGTVRASESVYCAHCALAMTVRGAQPEPAAEEAPKPEKRVRVRAGA